MGILYSSSIDYDFLVRDYGIAGLRDYGILLFFEVFYEFCDCFAAVTDVVFHFEWHLGKTNGKAVGHEDGVVAETFFAIALGQDLAVYTSFEIAWLAVLDEANYSSETCATVGFALHFGEHLVDVVVERAVFAGIACRVYTWSAVECFDFESGIVGKAVKTCTFIDPLCFLQCVAVEGVGRFGYVAGETDVVKTFD